AVGNTGSVAHVAADDPEDAGPPPVAQSPTAETEHVAHGRTKVSELPPLAASKDPLKEVYGKTAKTPVRPSKSMEKAVAGKTGKSRALAAACNVSDFTSRSGGALVQQIKASTTDCVNTLFNLTGSDAYYAFRESQMTSVAYALRDGSTSYPDRKSTTSELQSRENLVCRLLLEKKNKNKNERDNIAYCCM